MQYNLQDIAKFNIAKGLVTNHTNPEQFINYIKKVHFLLDIYEQHPKLKNDHENWLFYIINNISNVKNWVKKILPIMPIKEIHRINKDGNNVFMEAVKSDHLKTALLLIEKGANFNHVNNNGETFISFLSANLKKAQYKKTYFRYLIFISKFINNEFEKNISIQVAQEIKEFLNIAKLALEFQRKSSNIVGFPEYWDNIINYNQKIITSSLHLEEIAFKNTLQQNLKKKPYSNIIVKI